MVIAMTQSVDCLILARWLVPVKPENKVLENHGVAIANGKIVAIESQHELKNRYSAPCQFDLKSHVLIPGLVNAHTHAAMNLLKGYADDLPLMTWLQEHIWPAEGRMISDEFVYQGTRLAIAEMLKGGTTCFNEMYFMPNMAAKAALDVGIRANIGLTILDFPTAWAGDANQYIAKGLAVYDEFKHQQGLTFSLAPHAPYTVSDEPLSRIATLAEELDIGIHMHIHETAFEVEQAIKQTGERPLARLHQLGLLSPLLQAVHMTQINDEDLKLVKDNGVHVMHCPESNMKLASGICPTAKLLEAGVNIAIGTDGCASNNDLDMIGEMRSAALLAKVGSGDASIMSAFETLKAATFGGAKALGIDSQTGSIEVGKAGDLCAIDLNHIATQPIFNPISQLVYSATRDQVSHVWTQGQLQVEQGQLKNIDTEECLDIARYWQKKLLHKPS
jgi:5-methylthioadenosine/S-adenosylhomocysteine deaminase